LYNVFCCGGICTKLPTAFGTKKSTENTIDIFTIEHTDSADNKIHQFNNANDSTAEQAIDEDEGENDEDELRYSMNSEGTNQKKHGSTAATYSKIYNTVDLESMQGRKLSKPHYYT